MNRVLELLRVSPIACCFSVALGVGILLSVALIDPADNKQITMREILGAVFLLLPGLAMRSNEESYTD
ncbi:MAG: hypothetical protein HY820_29105 [Acidobacteria bacterium]|nr:hypothetical protein [Acidobacteriota bacterium]